MSISVLFGINRFIIAIIFRSPGPKAHRFANGIPITLASVYPSAFSNISFETTWPIELKFLMETTKDGGKKLFKWSWSHDQDGHQAHMVKPL